VSNFKSAASCELGYPSGVGVNSAGEIIIADATGHRIVILSVEGACKKELRGGLQCPIGIAINSKGDILATDAKRHLAVVVDGATFSVSEFGAPGTGNGQFDSPGGTATDHMGNILIADKGNGRLVILSAEGICQRTVALGSDATPAGVAVDSNRNIWITDSGKACVQVFSESGQLRTTFGKSGKGDGEFNSPKGIAIDGDDNVYLADCNNHRLQVFSSALELVGLVEGLYFPEGIAVSHGGLLVISEPVRNQVRLFMPQENEIGFVK